MKRLTLLLAVTALGCGVRLSDPIYALRSLRAQEPPGPEYSLLLVTVDIREVSLETLDSIYFRRVDPDVGTEYHYTTKAFLYRVFERRQVKDGHFLVMLRPGVYELDQLQGYSYWRAAPVRYVMKPEARAASRIYITRPGVYDLGTLVVEPTGGWASYRIRGAGDAGTPARRSLLAGAIRDTSWESLHDQTAVAEARGTDER
jgi:hypothetical protein